MGMLCQYSAWGCTRSHTKTPLASALMLAQVGESLVISTAYLSDARVLVFQDDGPHPEAL